MSTRSAKITVSAARAGFLAAVKATAAYRSAQHYTITQTAPGGDTASGGYSASGGVPAWVSVIDLVVDTGGNVQRVTRTESAPSSAAASSTEPTSPTEDGSTSTNPSADGSAKDLVTINSTTYLPRSALAPELTAAAETYDALEGVTTVWYTRPASKADRFDTLFINALNDTGIAAPLAGATKATKTTSGGKTTYTFSGPQGDVTAVIASGRIYTIHSVAPSGLIEVANSKQGVQKLMRPLGFSTALAVLTPQTVNPGTTDDADSDPSAASMGDTALRTVADGLLNQVRTSASKHGGKVVFDDVAEALEHIDQSKDVMVVIASESLVRVIIADPNNQMRRFCVDFNDDSVQPGICR